MNDTAARDIELVQQSFDVISVKGDEFTELFYRNLFEDYPDARALFVNVDLVRQRKKLFAMLTLVVTHLSRMDVVIPVLEELGRRHVHYGVGDEFYSAFVETFLKTLGQAAPELWNRDLADAWRRALERICGCMIDARTGTSAGSRAQSDDLQLLMQISGQPIISSAHTRLFSAFLAKKVQDHDLEVARNVQRTLLPEALPEIEDYEIHACYDPARAVGGDYYDCIMLDEHRICISFGDVCGKGVPAALIMARLASAVQSTLRFAPDVREAFTAINTHMCHRAVEGRFVTFVLVVLDLENHSVRVLNAGHRAPLLRPQDGMVEELGPDAVGPPLGIVESHAYEFVERPLSPGDTIVLFTDGVDEAMNPGGEQYGMTRLREFLAGATQPAEDVGLALLTDVRRHAQDRPASDDITIVTITRRAAL